MKKQIQQRYTNVKADNAAEFATKLDDALKTLQINEQPQIDKNVPYLAHIFYLEELYVPENIQEEYESKGKRFYCIDCPYFNKPEDGRIKNVRCEYCNKYVKATSSACTTFYQRLHDGLIEVVFNEE